MAKDNLEAMRHSCEHVLQMAMQKFFPKIKPALGPAVDNGFYFDFDSNSYKISENDFKALEKEMAKIIRANLPIRKETISYKKAQKLFKNNPFKLYWLEKLKKEKKEVSLYYFGKNYFDLCSGPHLSETGKIGPFKLLSVAGAFWLGSEENKMLTRIYGACFSNKKELDKYLWQLKEAKKRDHRVLGQKLELFMFDDEVGQGLPLYLPKGALLKHLLMDFALNTYLKRGYQLVSTPHIAQESLWQHSGHLKFYAQSMYGPLEVEGKKYRLKPMNCPLQMKMFNFKKRSYRDLPLRWAEMGTVYRYEKSGELHGLTRPRGFTQDDAHIICTPSQLEEEIMNALDITSYIYKTLKMENLIYKLSVRDPDNLDKYFGSNQDWDKAENTLKKALLKSGHKNFEIDVGGAVFYAPKLDIDAIDALGRRWQLSTIQIDFNLPSRFNLKYTDKDGKEKTPFMIHRALLGSLERFIGVYLEHTAGIFPLWLAPIQVIIIPVSQKHLPFCQKIKNFLNKQNIRTDLDDRAETMQKKIKQAEEQKIPYIIVIGNKEIKENEIAVRIREEKKIKIFKPEKFATILQNLIEEKK